jgi:hypothetical protein
MAPLETRSAFRISDPRDWVLHVAHHKARRLIVFGSMGVFFKGAWDDAQQQVEEAADPHVRWTDAARWEK